MDPLALLIFCSVFAAVMLAALALGGLYFGEDSRLDTRLAPLLKLMTSGGVNKLWSLQRLPTPARQQSPSFLKFSGNSDERGHLQTLLIHAGIYAPWAITALTSTILVLAIVPLIAGVTIGGLVWGEAQHGFVIGLSIAVLAAALPWCWLKYLKRRRHVILTRSIPDFLDLMVACLESGISIDAALLRVIDELQLAHPLLAGELRVVRGQIELGATADAAVRTFADRSDFDSLRSLSTVLQQARRFGTGLADALRQHADELRILREQAAEEKAQQAAVKVLVPTMLLIFPAIFVVLAGPAAIQLSETFANPDPVPATAAHSPAK